MRADGVDNLMIVSDFDRTLSKNFYPYELNKERAIRLGVADDSNGTLTKGRASFDLMQKYDKMDEADRQANAALFNQYRPIEINYAMPLEERKEHMRQWWMSSLGLFAKQQFSLEDFNEMIY
jgi:hypothetical protein